MIDFGATLRQAREAKGLTLNDVATTTHMMVQMVEDLENERFGRIAAPIYGRGFVKLYCNMVGLDSEPLVAEFMEIYNGTRELDIKERVAGNTPPPEPPLREWNRTEDDSPFQGADVESPAGQVDETPSASPEEILSRPTGDSQPDLFSEQEAPIPPMEDQPQESYMANFSRYAPPVRQREDEGTRPQIARWLILAAAAALVAALILFGLHALYKATSAPRTDDEPQVPAEKAQAPVAAKPTVDAKPDSGRTVQKIPSLYID